MSNNPAVVIGISAVDNAQAVISGVEKKVQESAGKIDEAGTQVQSRWSQVASNFKANALKITTAAAGITAGIIGFATSFDILEKTQATANAMQVTYERSLQRLQKLKDSGKASADELATAELEVATNLDKLRLAQDAVSDTYTNFLANIPSQFLGFGTAAIGIFSTLKITQTANAVATVASAATYTGALASMNASTVATTGAMHGFRIASIMAFITNPVGAAIIGISALVAALVFNVGGLRDAVWSLGKTIFEFLDEHFKPLADAIRWFLGLFGPLNGGLDDAQAKTYAYAGSMDVLGSSTSTAAVELNLAEEFLKSQAEALAKSTQENFNLVASIYGVVAATRLNNEQLAEFADALRESKRLQEEATEAADNERLAQQRATDQIRERVEANIEFARSMGINIDATKTTVGETDRIRDHLERLKREYENSRERVEEFAIAHGVDVVKAVQMSDAELLNFLGSMGTVDKETSNTMLRLRRDFIESRDAVKNFQISASEYSSLFASNFTQTTNTIISENDRLQASIQATINKYEQLVRTGSGGGGSSRTVNLSGPPAASISTRFGRLAAIPNAQGGEGRVYGPTLFLAGDAGPEDYKFTPVGRGNSDGITVNIYEHNDRYDIEVIQGGRVSRATKFRNTRVPRF